MKKRAWVFAIFTVALTIAVNTLAYSSILNGSGTMINIMKKLNSAYITPRTYVNLAQRIQKKPNYSSNVVKQIDKAIEQKSGEFIQAAFTNDSSKMNQLLDPSAAFIRSADGSSFIRYIGDGVHVEGYMATDNKLIKAKQRWHVMESDNTVTCSMEVYIENVKSPQLWYLHFRRIKGEWKIFMLENDV